MSDELWKDAVDYEGFYQISDRGKVKSIARVVMRKDGKPYTVKERIITPYVDRYGYLRIELNKRGVAKKHYVHRLVGQAFIPNPDNKPQINHIDTNKKNNTVNNLDWVTLQENRDHAVANGLQPDQRGKNNPNIKLTKKDVLLTRKLKKAGKTHTEISKIVGTSVSNVNNIVGGYTWKWLKDGEKRLV